MGSGLLVQELSKMITLRCTTKAQVKMLLPHTEDAREEHFRLRDLPLKTLKKGDNVEKSTIKWQVIILTWLKIAYSNWLGK